MLLREVLTQPAKWSYLKSTPNRVRAVFKSTQCDYMFEANGIGYDIWLVNFIADTEDPDQNQDILGIGDQYSVMSTIVNIMKDFIAKHHPKEIMMLAYTSSRKKLYMRMIKQLLPTWSVDLEQDEIWVRHPSLKGQSNIHKFDEEDDE